MTIRQLKPIPSEPPPPEAATPRCQGTVTPVGEHQREWRRQKSEEYGGRPFQCSRPSVFEVDGCPLCRLHAGHRVLEMYLRGELIRA